MKLTEPLTTELTVAGNVWFARSQDANGNRPAFTRDPNGQWRREMNRAAHVLALLGGPRMMVIFHPSGYGD